MKHFFLLELFKKRGAKKTLITAALITILGLTFIFFINGANHSALIILVKQILWLLLLGIIGISLYEIYYRILQKEQHKTAHKTAHKTITALFYFLGIFAMFGGLISIDEGDISLKAIMLDLLFTICVCIAFYIKTRHYNFPKA